MSENYPSPTSLQPAPGTNGTNGHAPVALNGQRKGEVLPANGHRNGTVVPATNGHRNGEVVVTTNGHRNGEAYAETNGHNGHSNGHAANGESARAETNGHAIAVGSVANGDTANGAAATALNDRAAALALRRSEMSSRRAELMASATLFATADPLPPQSQTAASFAPGAKAMAAPVRRRGRKRWTALLFIGTSTILASVYYCKYASDQYLTVADYSIGSGESSGTKSGSGSITSMMGGSGGGSMATIADQYIVRDYVSSLQIIQDIKPFLDLRKIYSNPSADFMVRLNPKVHDEELLAYWNSMVTVNFDMTTGLSELRVRAFTPEDSKAIADRVLLLSEALVNRLSDRARQDMLRLAKAEVDSAYDRATKARDDLQTFSKTTQQIDPAAYVKANADIQGNLGADLVASQSQLDLLRKSLPEDAPGIRQLKDRIAVAQNQLASEKAQATNGEGQSANEIVNIYAKLNLENDFATQAYMSALSYLQSAQIQSSSQSCYLEAFVKPQLPQYAQYPQRLNCILLVALCSTVLWAIFSLLFAAIRDHS